MDATYKSAPYHAVRYMKKLVTMATLAKMTSRVKGLLINGCAQDVLKTKTKNTM